MLEVVLEQSPQRPLHPLVLGRASGPRYTRSNMNLRKPQHRPAHLVRLHDVPGCARARDDVPDQRVDPPEPVSPSSSISARGRSFSPIIPARSASSMSWLM